MEERVILGAMLLVACIGGVAFARLILFGVIDNLAMWANAYYGCPRAKREKTDPRKLFVLQRETGVYPLEPRS